MQTYEVSLTVLKDRGMFGECRLLRLLDRTMVENRWLALGDCFVILSFANTLPFDRSIVTNNFRSGTFVQLHISHRC